MLSKHFYEVTNFGILIDKRTSFCGTHLDVEIYKYKGEKYMVVYWMGELIRFVNVKDVKEKRK